MVKIRLSRGGVRRDPFYRIVVIDERKQIRGKVLATAGFWFPRKNTVNIKKEIVTKWLKMGAKLSPAVAKLVKEKNERAS